MPTGAQGRPRGKKVNQKRRAKRDVSTNRRTPPFSEITVPREARKSPPTEVDGLSNRAGGALPGANFVDAFAVVLQARLTSAELRRECPEIMKRRRVEWNKPLDPATRGEDLELFRAAYEIYRGSYDRSVRMHFLELMGCQFAEFEHALEVFGEALHDMAPAPRPIVGYGITPEAFSDE